MKYLDRVRVTVSKEEYEKFGVHKGDEGVILFAEIRANTFYVVFCDKMGRDYADIGIHIGDLELVREVPLTDEDILEDLPSHDPNWWCKVEDGYILNLKGERKNKIAYDYDS